MTRLLFTFLLSLWGFSINASVKPRYKAHLYFGTTVINGDSLFRNAINDFEVSFYEESELSEIMSSEQGTLGVKLQGRPVWREGKLTHSFIVQLHFRKITTDRWVLLTEREIKIWNSNPDFESINSSQYLTSGSNSMGKFSVHYLSKIELLESQYIISSDSNFLPKFTFQIKDMRINGKKVKLNKRRYESLYKRNGDFIVGKINKVPVVIKFELSRGTAKNDNDFEVAVYYSIVNKSTGQLVKEKVISQFVSSEEQTFGKVIQASDNDSELFFINFNGSVSSLFSGKFSY